MTLEIRQNPSPNFDARKADIPLKFIVLHYTGMKSTEKALTRLCDPAAKVSAHYLIDEAGQIFQLVDEKHRAWHAGESYWQGMTDINSASIGIELSNPGHEFGYRPFPPEQIQALKKLMHDIMRRHNLPQGATLAHSDIAPERKEDPGELFPWRELAAEGFGLWPVPEEADYEPAKENEAFELLRTIGYKCSRGNERKALLAFQRRYCPENFTGKPDKETAARLKALAVLAISDHS